jgi:uncharacterized protein (DUF1501 family)
LSAFGRNKLGKEVQTMPLGQWTQEYCCGCLETWSEGLSRRGFIKVGLGGLLSMLFADWLVQQPLHAQTNNARKAKSVILLWMNGGPSQLDTFDPKPNSRNGGIFKPIKTRIPDVQFTELLPQLAEHADKLAVIRSMVSRETNHQRAQYLLHTGYLPQGTVEHPSFGAVVAKELGDENFDLPHFVSIRGPSFGAGFLGSTYNPLVVTNLSQPVENLLPPQYVTPDRLERRLFLLRYLEGKFADWTKNENQQRHLIAYNKALRLMRSPLTKAFNIAEEPESVKQAYGDNDFGRGCLLARRLVEAGVRFVEVYLDGWDTHQDNFTRTQRLCSILDPAFATLLKELKERDLLDSTLVVWMGEFGRTPRINPNEGRDHWARGFSVVLAGGGIRGGQVVGATNEDGTDVVHRPVAVPDLFATLCHLLGIDPNKRYYTPNGRPVTIVDKGQVVTELLG